jgi:hypothetical protein
VPTRNPGSAYGEFSKTWTYTADSHAAVFSLDYPYAVWHDLQECYRNQGWDVEETVDHPAADGKFPKFFHTIKLKKAGMRSGYLFYCEFDRTGRAVAPARTGLAATLTREDSALHRWIAWMDQKQTPKQPPQVGTLFQFQLFVDCRSQLSGEDVNNALNRFLLASRRVQSQLFGK